MSNWKPVKWVSEESINSPIPEPISIVLVPNIKTAAWYAIRQGGYCLNRNLEMECEPMPSSRDAEFFHRCRFATFEYAADLVKRYLATQTTQ